VEGCSRGRILNDVLHSPGKTKEIHQNFRQNSRFSIQNLIPDFRNTMNIHHEFLRGKQTVSGKIFNDVIERLIAQVHRVRPEFQ
jgi:hypothetical protein